MRESIDLRRISYKFDEYHTRYDPTRDYQRESIEPSGEWPVRMQDMENVCAYPNEPLANKRQRGSYIPDEKLHPAVICKEVKNIRWHHQWQKNHISDWQTQESQQSKIWRPKWRKTIGQRRASKRANQEVWWLRGSEVKIKYEICGEFKFLIAVWRDAKLKTLEIIDRKVQNDWKLVLSTL